MANQLIIWIIFTFIVGFSNFNNTYFILSSFIMFFVVYIYNRIKPTELSLRRAILISIIPNTIFWYIAYRCNDFLWVYPFDWEVFIGIFLIYSYILMYIAWECK